MSGRFDEAWPSQRQLVGQPRQVLLHGLLGRSGNDRQIAVVRQIVRKNHAMPTHCVCSWSRLFGQLEAVSRSLAELVRHEPVEAMHSEEWTQRIVAGRTNELDNLQRLIAE